MWWQQVRQMSGSHSHVMTGEKLDADDTPVHGLQNHRPIARQRPFI
jgi:hypothetical protein